MKLEKLHREAGSGVDSCWVTKDLPRLVHGGLEALRLPPKLARASPGTPVTKRTVRTPPHQAVWLINSEEGKAF